MESSDQDGKETQVSFKTFEGGRAVVSAQRDHSWPAPSPAFRWNNLIPKLEKVCAPSKAQHSQGNPKEPEPKQPGSLKNSWPGAVRKKTRERRRK